MSRKDVDRLIDNYNVAGEAAMSDARVTIDQSDFRHLIRAAQGFQLLPSDVLGRARQAMSAAALTAAGLAIVDTRESVVADRESLSEILEACSSYLNDPERSEFYFWHKWGYQKHWDILNAALGQKGETDES